MSLVGVMGGYIVVVKLLILFGIEEQWWIYLFLMVSGELWVIMVLIEFGGGLDLQNMLIMVLVDGFEGFVGLLINGCKMWISNVCWFGFFVVLCKIDLNVILWY